ARAAARGWWACPRPAEPAPCTRLRAPPTAAWPVWCGRRTRAPPPPRSTAPPSTADLGRTCPARPRPARPAMMVGVTDDEAPGHRHERPEDWGWHGEFGRWARVAGW